ncbi:MAG TPA: MIP/aquaporin family protein [Ferruginibacter sp.]|jgi:glycerol uptake facilitator protein|nr:aquaporin family protein [Chitinophagales bacterium]HNA17745.1 MIP/aquaporin family protein [Ferruginibacter sp.]HNJ28093.1 MIP/aquaporin family protein [Ferruginibacter sp.]HQR01496.1 MIP/aquaporin family protein [Ferruginibacter sp.]
MTNFLFELIGTAFLILLGDGVVANVVLNKTKGNNGGWIVITVGWAMAVFVGVYTSAAHSGAHLNPAVSVAMAAAGKLEWSVVPTYIAGQFAGAMLGSLLVWIAYKKHFDETTDADAKLAVFCNSPAIRNTVANLGTEIIGTLVLVLGVFLISGADVKLGSLDALPVALLVLAIGLSLGGPTGYAINPARDLGPRIMHFILPIPGKRDSDWAYSWIPVIGPLLGGLLAVLVYKTIL